MLTGIAARCSGAATSTHRSQLSRYNVFLRVTKSGFSSTRLNADLPSPSFKPLTVNDIGFPYGDAFDAGDQPLDVDTVISLLEPYVTPERMKRIQKVVMGRAYNVLPIVEGVYDMGNLAAVCRSADAMGYGALHCVNTSPEKYKQSQRTAAGAEKWLDVRVWDNTAACVKAVKDAGFTLLVTHLTQGAVSVQDVDWTRPTAVVLGNEKSGVSEEMVKAADACVIIPMSGFVESFNISVAAALVMYTAQQQRMKLMGRHGDLSEQQQKVLQAVFMSRTVNHASTLLAELLSRPPPAWQAPKFK